MKNSIENVVIVGGGTSGWMSASYIKKSFPDVQVTVVEAPSIPRIGVGEATIPNLHTAFFRHLGIPEEVWMKRVNATFKMGIKFVNWSTNPQVGVNNAYYHLFGVMPNYSGLPLAHYWAYRRLYMNDNERFDYSCFAETYMADAKCSPRSMSGERIANYAWHFDSNLVAEYLKELSIEWGVKLIREKVVTGNKDAEGYIASVQTAEGTEVTGDLFVDCTGFRSTLIGGVMQESFKDMSSSLLCNSALATQLPSDDDLNEVNPYTTATALEAGWCWNIPLLNRYGTGYIYSDNHISDEDAAKEFGKHLNIDPEKHEWNKVKFPIGRRNRSWVKNCVGIGLSANFLEPLESTGLYLTYAAIYQLVRFFPDKNFDERLIEQFNSEVNFSFDDCKDFIQLHFVTTKRDDTEFWKANQHDLLISDSLKSKIKMYKAGIPINVTNLDSEAYYDNFEVEYRNFWTDSSYYAILTGMGVFPECVNSKIRYHSSMTKDSEQSFKAIKERSTTLVKNLPSHYGFLKEFHAGSRTKMMERLEFA